MTQVSDLAFLVAGTGFEPATSGLWPRRHGQPSPASARAAEPGLAEDDLLAVPDDQILAHATATGRVLVTANIKDFMPLDAQYRAAGQTHAGLIFISA
jgi:hypothetical protein